MDEIIEFNGIPLRRVELQAGLTGTVLLRLSEKGENSRLDKSDIRALLANAMYDGDLTLAELQELFMIYLMYIDRCTEAAGQALYTVLVAHAKENAPSLGYTAKGVEDIFYVYHHQRSQMTDDAKGEVITFLNRFFS